MSSNGVAKISGGLDWLTLTTEKEAIGLQWASTWLRLEAGERSTSKFYGFEGHRSREGCFYGRRPKDGRYILILVGSHAQSQYPQVLPIAGNVTRVDLATDLWMSVPTTHIHDQATKLLDPDFKTRAKVVYIQGLQGKAERPLAGNTLYIGSRQSTQFGRLYDKGLHLGVAEPGKWLRYEVEFKAAAAKQALEAIERAGLEKAGLFVQRACYDWFKTRGVVPNYEPGEDCEQFKVRSFIRQTTNDKKLVWLKTQVQPTIQYLLLEGLDTEVTSALGMEGWSNKLGETRTAALQTN